MKPGFDNDLILMIRKVGALVSSSHQLLLRVKRKIVVLLAHDIGQTISNSLQYYGRSVCDGETVLETRYLIVAFSLLIHTWVGRSVVKSILVITMYIRRYMVHT